MSEYDQMVGHQVNSSGNCVISGCPCRGWSAQGTAGVKEVAEYDPRKAVHRIKLKHEKVVEAAKLLLAMNNCNYDRDQMRRSGGFDALWEAVKAIEPNWTKESSSEHQPTARGGGDEWRVVELGRNTYIERDTESPFICDMQTYDSSDAERKEARQLAHQIVNEHRQHHSLVAEQERLRAAIEVAIHNLNAGSDPKFLADYLRLTLDQKRGAR